MSANPSRLLKKNPKSGFTPLETGRRRRLTVVFGNRSLTGFTIVEITVAVIVVAVLATFALVLYFKTVAKSQNTEALVNLDAIRKAQLSKLDESGTFVNATDTSDINKKLPTVEVQEKDFKYKIENASSQDFKAIAEPTKPDTTKSKPIEIAMNSNGDVTYTYGPGYDSGFTSTGGGTSYGSGGGGGGGGGGVGGGFGISGGSSGGGGGSSGGGSSGGGTSGGGTGSADTSGGGSSSTPFPLADVMAILANSTAGSYFYDLIQQNHVNIIAESMSPSLGGMFVPSWWLDFYPTDPFTPNTIYLNADLQYSWSKEALATILIHESLHADYVFNTDKWVAETTQRLGVNVSQLNWQRDPVTGQMVLQDSVDQEFNAFTEEVILWKEIKGSQTSAELDPLLADYEADQLNGTDLLYQEVASRYQGYASYNILGRG